MKIFKLALVAGVVALASLTTSAFADTVHVAYSVTPNTTGSWDIGPFSVTLGTLNAGAGVNADKAVFTWVSGSQFEITNPASLADKPAGDDFFTDGFTPNTWTEASGSTATSATANKSGGAGQTFIYRLDIQGTLAAGIATHYTITFFNGTNAVAFGDMVDTYNSSANKVDVVFNLTTVPLPMAAWAGFAMLGGMGLVMVRRRRARNISV